MNNWNKENGKDLASDWRYLHLSNPPLLRFDWSANKCTKVKSSQQTEKSLYRMSLQTKAVRFTCFNQLAWLNWMFLELLLQQLPTSRKSKELKITELDASQTALFIVISWRCVVGTGTAVAKYSFPIAARPFRKLFPVDESFMVMVQRSLLRRHWSGQDHVRLVLSR